MYFSLISITLKKSVIILIILVLLVSKNLFSQKKQVKIYSSDSIENSILKGIKFNKKEIISKELLLDHLKLKGFFYSFIDSIISNQKKDSIVYKVSLGKRIDSLQLNIPKKYSYLKDIIPSLKPKSDKINFSNLEKILQQVKNHFSTQGKTFTTIRLTNIQLKNKTIISDLKINESNKRVIEKILIKGYKDFPRSYLNYFLKIKKGDTFDKNKISIIPNNINSLKFVKTTKQPEVLFKKDSTTIYLYLEKRKQNSFDGLINFSTNPITKKLLLTGNLNLELINLLNTGEELNLSWNANGNESQNINLQAKTPYMFNSPISNSTLFEIHKQDSTFLNSKFQTNLLYSLNPKSEIGINFETETSNNTLSNSINNIENYSNSFIGLSYRYKTQKSHPIFKTKFFLQSKYQFGTRTTEDHNQTQNKLNLETYYIFDINTKNSIFLRNESNILLSNSYLVNELFRIGGPNSIRGINQQSIFSTKYTVFNLEYRIQTNLQSYLYSITDLAITEGINKLKNNFITLGAGYSFFVKKSKIDLVFSSNFNKNTTNYNGFNLSISFKNYF